MVKDLAPITQSNSANLLIRALSEDDFARFEPLLERVELEKGEVLAKAGESIEWVYFPEVGIATLSETVECQTRIGIAHVGYDGLVGWPVLLGSTVSPHEARITAEGGTALRIASRDLVELCNGRQSIRSLLLRFVQAMFVQVGRTVVSSLTQPVETRLCRWTLMAHDRVPGDRISVTHDEIAVMLAVRRATITDLLHRLEGERLIRSERGTVVVLDREGLVRCAGESYGHYEAEYSRMIASFPPED